MRSVVQILSQALHGFPPPSGGGSEGGVSHELKLKALAQNWVWPATFVGQIPAAGRFDLSRGDQSVRSCANRPAESERQEYCLWGQGWMQA